MDGQTMITFKALTALFLIIWYLILRWASVEIIRTRIYQHTDNATIRSGFWSNTLVIFLRLNRNYLISIGSLLFPLFWCFNIGIFFGNKIYNILIDNKDENRIASWVI